MDLSVFIARRYAIEKYRAMNLIDFDNEYNTRIYLNSTIAFNNLYEIGTSASANRQALCRTIIRRYRRDVRQTGRLDFRCTK